MLVQILDVYIYIFYRIWYLQKIGIDPEVIDNVVLGKDYRGGVGGGAKRAEVRNYQTTRILKIMIRT